MADMRVMRKINRALIEVFMETFERCLHVECSSRGIYTRVVAQQRRPLFEMLRCVRTGMETCRGGIARNATEASSVR